MSQTPTPKQPGRGFWSELGGLLPPRPGEHGRGGYYRAASAGEVLVGAAGLAQGATYNEVVVTAGVRALQKRANELQLGTAALALTGQVGPRTGDAFRAIQARWRLTEDGICGPKTVRAVVVPIVVSTAMSWGVPAWCLGGIVGAESQWDPAAVGVKTPADTGICQINRAAHPGVTVEQATDFEWALEWTAKDLIGHRQELARVARPGMDAWELAVAAHNSPRAAKEWAESGIPGTDPDPLAYVTKVHQAWEEAKR